MSTWDRAHLTHLCLRLLVSAAQSDSILHILHSTTAADRETHRSEHAHCSCSLWTAQSGKGGGGGEMGGETAVRREPHRSCTHSTGMLLQL